MPGWDILIRGSVYTPPDCFISIFLTKSVVNIIGSQVITVWNWFEIPLLVTT